LAKEQLNKRKGEEGDQIVEKRGGLSGRLILYKVDQRERLSQWGEGVEWHIYLKGYFNC